MFRKTARTPCWKSPVPWAHCKSSPVLTALCTQKLHRYQSIKTTQGSFFFPLLTSLSANFQPGKPLALVLLWDQQWHWKSKGWQLQPLLLLHPANSGKSTKLSLWSSPGTQIFLIDLLQMEIVDMMPASCHWDPNTSLVPRICWLNERQSRPKAEIMPKPGQREDLQNYIQIQGNDISKYIRAHLELS